MIAVDWGTSSLRLYRLTAEGGIIERRSSTQGALACGGRFAEVLLDQIDGWDDPVVLLSGMIGSRNGWQEAPYLECPAGVHEIANAIRPLDGHRLDHRNLWLIPGLKCHQTGGMPDVMRGEEMQIMGLPEELLSGTHQVCLPGTHSKWATLNNGKIQSFSTSITGEMYALLRQHSSVGKLIPTEAELFDEDAFDSGLRTSGEVGGCLHHLFGVRTAGLFDHYADSQLSSYLSGLLIGHEIRDIRRLRKMSASHFLHVVGSERLRPRYTHAFSKFGIGVLWHHENRVANGLHKVATASGIISH